MLRLFSEMERPPQIDVQVLDVVHQLHVGLHHPGLHSILGHDHGRQEQVCQWSLHERNGQDWGVDAKNCFGHLFFRHKFLWAKRLIWSASVARNFDSYKIVYFGFFLLRSNIGKISSYILARFSCFRISCNSAVDSCLSGWEINIRRFLSRWPCKLYRRFLSRWPCKR